MKIVSINGDPRDAAAVVVNVLLRARALRTPNSIVPLAS